MNRLWNCLPVITGLLLIAPAPAAEPKPPVADIKKLITDNLPHLEGVYKYIHSHPELSLQEQQTAVRLAKELRSIGFEVTEKVGGNGVVGVLKNGNGPTIMIRTDMDALPVTENTGLPYASRVTVRGADGLETGVMHACGHDMHMTCWVGTARVLAALKDRWKGTVVFIAQPAEETGTGARMMLEDKLFERFPRPDYALALHCDGRIAHGTVSYTEGLALANVDSVDIVVKGRGGHGAAPHTTVDPVVLAARIVLDLQTIASREVDPVEPVVVTVGSIHGGTKHNIIPSEVRLQLTVRTTKDSIRKHVLDAIERIAKAAAQGARAPVPEVTVQAGEFTPALVNDAKLTRKVVPVLQEVLGEEKVLLRPLMLGGEDFSRYGRAGVPIFMYFLGTIDPDRVAAAAREGRELPSLHSEFYYPVPEPSIRAGVLTMSAAVLSLLGQ